MVTHHTVDDLLRPLGFARDTASGVGPAQDELRSEQDADDPNRDRGPEPGTPPAHGGF